MPMKKFTKVLPITLFRIQPRLPVSLRDYDVQMAKNRTSFDLKLKNGLIQPMDGLEFHTPNGMSLRPLGPNMIDILNRFRGEATIYRLQEATPLPEGTVLFHEHSDHYSLQVESEMKLEDFNEKLTNYLKSLPAVSKKDFLEAYDDLDDQDN